MLLTQFSTSGSRRKCWREDLEEAAQQTILDFGPDFAKWIQLELDKKLKKSPRQDWLQEKAYMWLKSLHSDGQKYAWYPHHAIEVAHKLFLSDTGKFDTFVKYLSHPARRKQPPMDQLIRDPDTMTPTGLY